MWDMHTPHKGWIAAVEEYYGLAVTWQSSLIKKGGKIMFEFQIIDMPDGNQIIDMTLKTPYSALTAVQMAEYTEMDNQLTIMDRMNRRKQKEAEQQRKLAKNPLYRLACFLGIA